MGLDIYVGSLTRYYRRDWETVMQRAGREAGIPVQILYARETEPDAALMAQETRAAVLEWRSGLAKLLVSDLSDGLNWSEESTAPYFTDKPDWNGYGALVLRCAYAEHPQHARPAKAVKDWQEASILKASCPDDVSTRFPTLIHGVELWLPDRFDFTFTAMDATGEEVSMGSTGQLRAELAALNQMSWRASDDEIREWRREVDPNTDSFDELARFGYSIF